MRRLKGNPCGPLRPNTINVTMPTLARDEGKSIDTLRKQACVATRSGAAAPPLVFLSEISRRDKSDGRLIPRQILNYRSTTLGILRHLLLDPNGAVRKVQLVKTSCLSGRCSLPR